MSYMHTYVWNLEKQFRRSYLQSRSRDTDVEKKHIWIPRGKGGWEELGDWG